MRAVRVCLLGLCMGWMAGAQEAVVSVSTPTAVPGEKITLQGQWPGLDPRYRNRYELRFQWSYQTNPAQWNDIPNYVCTQQPCTYALGLARQGEAKLWIRVSITDTATRKTGYSKMVQPVSWLNPQPQVPPPPPQQRPARMSLTARVNGLGCSVTVRPGDMSEGGSSCYKRSPLDVHQDGVPLIRLVSNGVKGQYVAPSFTVQIEWNAPSPWTWYAIASYGGSQQACYSSPCTVVFTRRSIFNDSEFGRDVALVGIHWDQKGGSPYVDNLPVGMKAEIGLDYLKP